MMAQQPISEAQPQFRVVQISLTEQQVHVAYKLLQGMILAHLAAAPKGSRSGNRLLFSVGRQTGLAVPQLLDAAQAVRYGLHVEIENIQGAPLAYSYP